MVEIILDIETTGLEPVKSDDRITCISMLKDNYPVTFYGENEKSILENFWFEVSEDSIIYTFNGESFDIPFIIARSLKYGIMTKKIEHVDLRLVINPNRYARGSLNDFARLLGLELKSEDGLEVVKAYKDGDWDLIQNHCKYDVEITKKLLDRCKECGLL